MNSKPPSRRFLAINWITLVVLHFAILGSAYLNLKSFGTPLILGLAIFQMLLIFFHFMEVRWSAKLIWLFASASFFWLLILFTLIASDYFTRGWH